ncbi:type II toxin-antitoxin system PemK/MazF family toxin [Promicromonospora kroppenstedtii]|uniref:Type II toxin-antitoxin system PemK/MazF family toxin n=1 Tax=Promicromonospora kroppenstedtii TaxID=440482 RepID=A0ABW7XQQ9_9MICO|nr:type II toxin-antitoxin system PemK/MazF family toxin [Promicromonospora kroppenstedtii]
MTFASDNSYPGDYEGEVHPVYHPQLDGEPDPGEVVWTWVPFEEDHSQGKDRPVLLVGHDGPWLLGLQLTSQDHDREDLLDEARAGRIWMDVGTGRWDRSGRESEVRINRVIRIDPDDVRREGDVLDEARFDEVVKYMDRALDLT